MKCDSGKGKKRKAEQANLVSELQSELGEMKKKIERAESIADGTGMSVDLQFDKAMPVVETEDNQEDQAMEVVETDAMDITETEEPEDDQDMQITCTEKAFPAVEKTRFKVDSGATSNFSGMNVPLTNIKTINQVCEIADGRNIHINKRGKFRGTTSAGQKMEFPVKQAKEFSESLFSPHFAAKGGFTTVLRSEDSYLESSSGTRIPLERTDQGWDLVLGTGEDEP
jgi:hypothetical protein